MAFRVILLLVTNIVLIHGAAVLTFHGAVRDDSGVNIDAYTPAERKCFEQQEVLHEADGKCYRLLGYDPCSENGEQVFVLDKDAILKGKVRGVCKKSPCPGPGAIFWAEDGKCHKLQEHSRLCPLQGTLPQKNPFGEGECLCRKKPLHIHWEVELANREGDERVKCYQLYGRGGPCREGSIFVATEEIYSGKCVRDPCASQNARPGEARFAVWEWGDRKTCYELGTGGPCSSGLQFEVHPETMRPECYSTQLSTIALPPRDNSQPVRAPASERFVLSILIHTAKKPRRRGNH